MQTEQTSGCSDKHARYVQLCALFTTGSLSSNELEELDLHISICEECRTLLTQYRRIARRAIPLVVEAGELEGPGVPWEYEKARRRLLAALDGDERERPTESEEAAVSECVQTAPIPRSDIPTARSFLLILLGVAIGVGGYVMGTKHGRGIERPSAVPVLSGIAMNADLAKTIERQLDLDTRTKERDEEISRLSDRVTKQVEEIRRLQTATDGLRQENDSIRSDREAVTKKLEEAQLSLTELRGNLARLQSEQVADQLQTATMQDKIDQLNREVSERNATIAQQQRLLESDLDVRELMGTRDLYIADVFDVDQNGKTRKPFGRVFYTKKKSLIFYAFDLEKQSNAANAMAFQAWGERSADRQRPVNLGIFYVDNEANRRWVLKFDDPKAMEQINAVFVTVEPKGGSERPSGKQLLYAYLPTQPNHP